MTGTAELGVRTDPALVADGWVRRYLADPERAREAVETYGAAGFEVRLEPLKPGNFAEHCQGCAAIVCRTYVVVYTRKKPGSTP
jgi:hypothetical protein